MNKTATALLAVISGAVGFAAGSSAQAEQPVPVVKLINTKLVRVEERLPDGGSHVSWAARSCGYEMPTDGGTRQTSEPCWETRVEGALFAPVEKALLAR